MLPRLTEPTLAPSRPPLSELSLAGNAGGRAPAQRSLKGNTPVIDLLDAFGPEFCSRVRLGQAAPLLPEIAQRYCQELADSHYENFSVLSPLVPDEALPDFAAVYAFCRWADDLGDETGSDETARERSTRLLAWWQSELDACYTGDVVHPVYLALVPVILRHDLPKMLLSDLISAFAQDQIKTRYETIDEVLDYCRRSANPVGRLVLYLAGHRPSDDPAGVFAKSDLVCTALQLVNLWQDVRRDLLERNRIYLPQLQTGLSEEKLRAWQNDDRSEHRLEYIKALRPLVQQADAMFAAADDLPSLVNPRFAAVIWLFAAGGRSIARKTERLGCTTLWHRPRLSKLSKLSLVARAWWMNRRMQRTSAVAKVRQNAPQIGATQ